MTLALRQQDFHRSQFFQRDFTKCGLDMVFDKAPAGLVGRGSNLQLGAVLRPSIQPLARSAVFRFDIQRLHAVLSKNSYLPPTGKQPFIHTFPHSIWEARKRIALCLLRLTRP